MKRTEIKFITEIGIFSAIALALDYVAGVYSNFIWPLGGSISIAMVPIFIMAFRWGLKGGLFTGLIVGTVQIIWSLSGEAHHPIQIILDYPVAYGVVGIAGIYAKKIAQAQNVEKLYYLSTAIIIGGGLRFFPHAISGYVYFRQYTPEGLPIIPWIIIYNLGYLIPSIILSILILRLIVKKREELITYNN